MREITRSADHHYTFRGETFPGVTGILKVLDKSDALMTWAARNTAEAAVKAYTDGAFGSLLDNVGPAGVVKALTARAGWARDAAASLGTAVHDYAERVARGQLIEDVLPDGVRERVHHYRTWWLASGWTMRATEAMVINPVKGYGGTIDLLARDGDGRLTLADVKTGKGGAYPEYALQLAAYADALWIETESGLHKMPNVERFVILHVTTEGVREIEMRVGMAETKAFEACLELARWREAVKSRRA